MLTWLPCWRALRQSGTRLSTTTMRAKVNWKSRKMRSYRIPNRRNDSTRAWLDTKYTPSYA